jgi:hypothetical protein
MAKKLTQKEKDQILDEILKKVSDTVESIAGNPEIVDVKVDYADTFWGYYIRGYDSQGKEKFVGKIELDERLWDEKEGVEIAVVHAIDYELAERDFKWNPKNECYSRWWSL